LIGRGLGGSEDKERGTAGREADGQWRGSTSKINNQKSEIINPMRGLWIAE
jgi:hypothetical protein